LAFKLPKINTNYIIWAVIVLVIFYIVTSKPQYSPVNVKGEDGLPGLSGGNVTGQQGIVLRGTGANSNMSALPGNMP